jgi:hypothetical protein
MVAIPKLLLLWTVLFFLVWGLLMLCKPKHVVDVIGKVVKNQELSFILGLVLFILGFLYILVYAKFDGTWYILFPIL